MTLMEPDKTLNEVVNLLQQLQEDTDISDKEADKIQLMINSLEKMGQQ